MKSIILILLSIILSINLTFAQWTQCNSPFGKTIDKLKKIDNTIYVLSDNELFSSTDNAETWVRSKFQIKCDIYDIHKSNGYLFIATVDGVFRSSNNGETWSDRSFGLGRYIRSLESEGNILFCLQGQIRDRCDLYVSTNNGDSWTQATSDLGTPYLDYIGFSRLGSTLYLNTGSRVYLWNGTKFSDSPSKNVSGDLKSFATDGRVSIFNIDGYIYRSIDGGKNRTPIKDCNPWAEIEFKDTLLYLYDNGIFTSNNYGETWKSITSILDNLSNPKKYYLFGTDEIIGSSISGIYSTKLNETGNWVYKNAGLSNSKVDMIDKVEDDLYISNSPNSSFDEGIGLLRSSDGGNSWNKLDNGFQGKGKFNFVLKASGRLYTGNGYGLFRSIDNGEYWTNIYSESIVKKCISQDGNLYIVTGRGIAKSKDQGDSWTSIFENRDINSLVVVNNNLIACGLYGIYVSTDMGVSWTHVLKNNNILALHVYNSKMFAGGSKLFNSEDFGMNWTQIGNDYPSINDIDNIGPILYMATSRGILKSKTNGFTWEYYNQGFSELTANPCDIFGMDSAVFQIVSISDEIYAATSSKFVISRKIDKEDVTSIVIQEDNINFSVYPNPTFNNATIGVKVFSEVDYITRIEVTDLLGNLRLQKLFDSNVSETTLEVNELDASIYFLKIFTTKNMYSQKLIISK